jgi:hypothetical protein
MQSKSPMLRGTAARICQTAPRVHVGQRPFKVSEVLKALIDPRISRSPGDGNHLAPIADIVGSAMDLN